MNKLEKALFDSGSIKIAPVDRPFWYTSGTIGPYFINTHFLYGGEKDANELLEFIDKKKYSRDFIPALYERVIGFYKKNQTYKKIMDDLYDMIRISKKFAECAYVAGGERRDWFFSPVIAMLSGKKPLFIFKDLNVFSLNDEVSDLRAAKVAHICDLVTQASSYERTWIPAIDKINGRLNFNASVVDRNEGGREFFAEQGIEYFPAVVIDEEFLKNVRTKGIITTDQVDLIEQFKSDPEKYGKEFIKNNPAFFTESIVDPSTCAKAVRCYKDNPYGLNFSKIVGKDKVLLSKIKGS
jgi:hypothetical protein